MKKIAILFTAIMITAPIISVAVSNASANAVILDDLLGLDKRNDIYMLIRNTTWDIRGAQDMDLCNLCSIRTSAETSIGLMIITPGPNPLFSMRLSFAIFLLAVHFSIEDAGGFQYTIELYREMIVPIRESIKNI